MKGYFIFLKIREYRNITDQNLLTYQLSCQLLIKLQNLAHQWVGGV